MEYLIFIAGLLIIVKMSDIFLDKAIYISRALKISEIIVGATIVSFCTVLPETVISLSAVLKNDTAMGFGNAVGSVVCNTALILGLGIMFGKPVLKNTSELIKNVLYLLVLCFTVFISLVKYHSLSRVTGFVLLGITLIFVIDNVKNKKSASVVVTDKSKILLNTIMLFISAVFIALSSRILVSSGQKIAENLGVPNMIIGLVLTAVGSSLPEFVTCITAIKKNAPEISFGNIIGANILNVGMIVGLCAVIKPFVVDIITSSFCTLAAICFTFYLLLCFIRKNKTLYPADGLFMVLAYFFFIGLSIIYS